MIDERMGLDYPILDSYLPIELTLDYRFWYHMILDINMLIDCVYRVAGAFSITPLCRNPSRSGINKQSGDIYEAVIGPDDLPHPNHTMRTDYWSTPWIYL